MLFLGSAEATLQIWGLWPRVLQQTLIQLLLSLSLFFFFSLLFLFPLDVLATWLLAISMGSDAPSQQSAVGNIWSVYEHLSLVFSVYNTLSLHNNIRPSLVHVHYVLKLNIGECLCYKFKSLFSPQPCWCEETQQRGVPSPLVLDVGLVYKNPELH